jgi:DNA replication protein DnaC
MTPPREESLTLYLRALRLPAFTLHWQEVAAKGEKEGWSFGQFLHHLSELELNERSTRRIARVLKASGLPATKTLGNLDLTKLPDKVRRALPRLCEGGFVDQGENLLVFGLPGRGKTHVVCAIGHELVRSGRTVLFSSTNLLVQRLLAAKRDLVLERELKRLDAFDALILDDLGYVQQDRAEMEVLFTLLAERYERKSVIITTNPTDCEPNGETCRDRRSAYAWRGRAPAAGRLGPYAQHGTVPLRRSTMPIHPAPGLVPPRPPFAIRAI